MHPSHSMAHLHGLRNGAGRGGRTSGGVKCCQEDLPRLHVSKGSHLMEVKAKHFGLNAVCSSSDVKTAMRICTKTAAKYNHGTTSAPTNIHVPDTDDLGDAAQMLTTSKAELNEH